MSLSLILFLTIAVIAVATALAMVFTRNAVYSVLLLILNFASVAVLYLMLNAPFIAVAQITVYAGAIMVLFLFVIMLLGAERARAYPPGKPWWLQPLPLALSAILLGEGIFVVLARLAGALPAVSNLPAGFGEPQAIGELLFTQYLLPVEATAILLLIAMVGAIVLIKIEKKSA